MEVDLNIIKTTQTSLGKYVKRPPLSEKLLKKPPFRFIHDIVTSVLKTTGFFNGLFEENELVSENVKDREAKVAFLNKIIFVVAHTTGKKLTAKPSKIVAGQEPEKTNELFQCLAEALDKKLTSEDAVKKFKKLKGISVNENTKEAKIEKKSPPKKKDESTKVDKSQAVKNKPKENLRGSKETAPKDISAQSKVKVNDHLEPTNNLNIESQSNGNDLNQSLKDTNDVFTNDSSSIKLEDSKPAEILEIKKKDLIKGDNNNPLISENQTINQLSTTSQVFTTKSHDLTTIKDDNDEKSHETTVENELSNQEGSIIDPDENKKDDYNLNNKLTNDDINSSDNTELDTFIGNKSNLQHVEKSNKRPSSARPTSSRPSAPRVREKYDNNISSTNITALGKVNIISENVFQEEEEESSIIIQTTSDLDALAQQIDPSSKNDHGHLVQQILDSQKEFSTVSGKTEIEWQFEAQKARDDMNKDIENLRINIQALSRIANPLGKLLDHIQEDVEVMRQESLQWIQTCEETTKELSKQKAVNEELLLPLHSKIKQLEAEVVEKREKINDLKIIVHKNSTRIEMLLTNGSVQ